MTSKRINNWCLTSILMILLTTYTQKLAAQTQKFAYFGQEKLLKMESRGAAQSLIIAYQDKLPVDGGFINAMTDASWHIYGDQTNADGIGGESLANFSFNTPGDYTIEINYTDNKTNLYGMCGENPYPSMVELTVLPYAISVDFQTLHWSSPLQSGKNMQGATLEVDVYIQSSTNEPVLFDWNLIITGVGSDLTGKVEDNLYLQPGKNTVSFSLSGMITYSNTYIGIDITDPVTGQTQVSYPSTPVN